MEAKFKVGDRVIFKTEHDNGGRTGKVTYIYKVPFGLGFKYVYSINLDNGHYVGGSEVNLELVPDKTADEMFEELGYVLQVDESDGCQYVYKKGNNTLVIDIEDCEYYIENEVNHETISFTFREHKAINKKLEELGWL